MATSLVVNPNEFQGYPLDLLRSLKGLGPALVGDAALYAAAKAYNDAAAVDAAGTTLGPALLTADCNTVVQSISAKALPDDMRSAPVDETADEPSSWDDHDLDSLLALCEKHGVVVNGRVKTPGKLIAALEAAGVAP